VDPQGNEIKLLFLYPPVQTSAEGRNVSSIIQISLSRYVISKLQRKCMWR